MHHVVRLIAGGISAAALVAPAWAGEEILYQPEPEWVEVAELPPADSHQGKPMRLIESQVLLDGGTVWEFRDIALAFETPEMLSQLGTVSANWLPDKGDLIVHRIELVRDGETLDVLADGAGFEVLRRERQLEQRILDGGLTATLAVPGLRVGDTLRVAYSVTRRDQALDGQMEWSSEILAEPLPVASGRIVLAWPEGQAVQHQLRRADGAARLTSEDGMTRLAIAMPLAEPPEMPDDAPVRFRLAPTVQAGTFDSWEAVSASMAPYYATEGTIAPGGAIAQELDRIRAAESDPLARAALAVQLVQEEVGYLMNGLDGGNYLPQSPAETWEKRYGDCKAKSLLLLAMLRELGIEAEAVLVSTTMGDAIPELLPVPGNFNHVIVRADIGGETYWLDGTSTGTRLQTMAAVPRFGHALPLREGEAGLQPIPARPLPVPGRTVRLAVDQRAGIALPALFDLELTVTGPDASAFRMLAQLEDGDQRDEFIQGAATAIIGDHRQIERSIAFDDESGSATVTVEGLMTTPWNMRDGRYRLEMPYLPAASFSFDNDRARAEWRDLPVTVNGPLFWRTQVEWLLPEDGAGFTVRGEPAFEREIGGNRLVSSGGIEGDRIAITQDVVSHAWEIPASELPATKREAIRMKRRLPTFVAPADTRRAWDYRGSDRAMLEDLEQAYAVLVEREDDDEAGAFTNRAIFRAGVGDWDGALADLDVALEREPAAWLYRRRAQARRQLGDLEGALADLQAAETLDPANPDHFKQVEILGQLGRGEEAIALAQDSALVASNPDWGDIQIAYAEGWAGQTEEGLERLADLVEFAAPGSEAFNALCWYSGIWNRATDETLPVCLKAVEQSAGGIGALDSRAMVLFRLGEAEGALTDLDKVLAASPDEHASRYMRGIVRLQLGDAGGREDIAVALAAEPALEAVYRAYGIAPPR
jgi:tetratricopeptide (TPR) repeat protein